MLSIRTLILLCATVYMLPKDATSQQRFTATAAETVSWFASTCEREPAFCEKADVVWQDLKSKAHFGAGVVYALATSAYDTSQRRTSPESGTLTAHDMAPAWRGDARSPR